MYCHGKLVRLEPRRSVLLIGDVCFVQGHFNNYFAEPIPVDPHTVVKLYSRTFEIRISSNRHCIFIRTEDIIKNRIRMKPFVCEMQKSPGKEETEKENTENENSEDSNEDSDDDLHESYDPDSAYDNESTDGSRGGGRRTPTRRTGRMGPIVQAPGAAGRARMVNAGTQTTPPPPTGARIGQQRPRTL